MLSEADASLDLCLKQWAEETAGELRGVLLSAATRIRVLVSEVSYLRSIPEADRNAENVVREFSNLHKRLRDAQDREAALRAENERLRKALEPVIEIAARNESSPVILRARSELEAGHE